jgi:hypothetical protein
MSVIIRALIFVASGGLIYLLLRLMPMKDAQRRFLMVVALTALFLVLAFGRHGKEAGIALLVFGMIGLLALDRFESRNEAAE